MTASRLKWLFGGMLVALLLLAAWNWQGILLGLAVASAEKRPALLDDADWEKPASARQFNARFVSGAPESALLDWLSANRFEVHRKDGRAERRVRSLPCNERIEISWTAKAKRLTAVSAMVREAGCL